jgi:hypothetical protein
VAKSKKATATKIKRLKGFNGEAALYKLDPPLKKCRQVVVSAAVVPFSGVETFIFPADKDGEISSWSELPGSTKGTSSHEVALRNAGYEVKA